MPIVKVGEMIYVGLIEKRKVIPGPVCARSLTARSHTLRSRNKPISRSRN